MLSTGDASAIVNRRRTSKQGQQAWSASFLFFFSSSSFSVALTPRF